MTNGIHKGMRTTLGGLHRMLDWSLFCNPPEVGRTLLKATTVQDQLTYASPDDSLPKRLLIRSIESLTGQRRLARVYDHVLQTVPVNESHAIWPTALHALKVHADYNREQLIKVPAEGPVVLVANHPYGVLDGLIICHLAAQIRSDFKILIHRALCIEPRVAEHMLPIDFSEGTEAIQSNIETKQRALATLRAGNAIVIFPAGGIATTANGPFGHAVDLEWKLFVAKLIQMTKATVLPIHFDGQNSRVFQLASHISETLRLALIIHEVNRQQGATIRVTIGDPIPYHQLADIRKRKELLHYLRNVIYDLAPTAVPHQQIPRLPSERRAERQQRIQQQKGRVPRTPILGELYSWRQLPRNRA
ncbi:MAG TPA: lysophospholipid acyltransferase family protein [Caldilineaceae bacterium]|nr:lysophospholipid acyltransferase family protein [Caldilineaceae bacterium]